MILEKSKIYNDVEDIIKYDKYSIFLELLKIKKEFEELKSKNGLMIDRIISDINNTEIYINDLDITNDDISFIISMQELEDIFSKKDKKVLNDYKLVSNYKLEEYIDFYDEKICELYNDIKIKIFNKIRNKVKSNHKNIIVMSKYSKKEKISNVKIEKCENRKLFKYKANIEFDYSLKHNISEKHTFNTNIKLKSR